VAAPQPAERVITEKNTKRDAVIGAAAGAVLGAATSRDKVKGAVIGAAAGAVIGGVIGNNVDVKKRRVPADTTRP
jgi:outer membrane lipoprotein SlyB